MLGFQVAFVAPCYWLPLVPPCQLLLAGLRGCAMMPPMRFGP